MFYVECSKAGNYLGFDAALRIMIGEYEPDEDDDPIRTASFPPNITSHKPFSRRQMRTSRSAHRSLKDAAEGNIVSANGLHRRRSGAFLGCRAVLGAECADLDEKKLYSSARDFISASRLVHGSTARRNNAQNGPSDLLLAIKRPYLRQLRTHN